MNRYRWSRTHSSAPSAVPRAVPATPMISPSMAKILRIERRVAPSVIRTAMSFVFSITTMIRVEMMLNAATITMRTRMTNITTFSSFRAEKRFRLLCIQSFAQNGYPRVDRIRCATAAAA